MISCTEFIPAYSELFTYLEAKHSRDEVDRFWTYLFQPDGKGIPLINYVEKEGIRGCFTYWSGSLNEEAADFTMYVNEKRGFFMLDMHQCPSKGRLLKLKEDIGVMPYHDYCLHCDHYRAAVEKVGLKYIYNFKEIDKAACEIIIYEPEKFDGRIIIDEETEIMDRQAAENEYFHRDFHSSMNMGIDYLGENYGLDAVKEYLTNFTQNIYRTVMEDMQTRGLEALQEQILDTYKKEKAIEVVHTCLSEDGNCLQVEIHHCPAIKYLKETGREVSKWYRYTTEIVMDVLASSIGYKFIMEDYDVVTGKASYKFEKY